MPKMMDNVRTHPTMASVKEDAEAAALEFIGTVSQTSKITLD
jgi:hypothetical protein